MKNFTLLELLIVIAIIGILTSILVPSLAKARYKSINVVCVSNMRQQGTAIISFTIDNDSRYSNSYVPSYLSLYNGSRYNNGALDRPTNQVKEHMEYVGFTGWRLYNINTAKAMSCPFAFDKYYNITKNLGVTWNKDGDGDGSTETLPRFPLGNVIGRTGYQNYTAFYQPKWGVVRKPMTRMGETVEYGNWANGAASTNESRVIMSDMSGRMGSESYYLSNHYPEPGSKNSIIPSSVYSNSNNRDGFYFKSHTQAGFILSNYYSANYMLDDGSVHIEKRIDMSNAKKGVHILTMPNKYFED